MSACFASHFLIRIYAQLVKLCANKHAAQQWRLEHSSALCNKDGDALSTHAWRAMTP
jgi:hypothetical protein